MFHFLTRTYTHICMHRCHILMCYVIHYVYDTHIMYMSYIYWLGELIFVFAELFIRNFSFQRCGLTVSDECGYLLLFYFHDLIFRIWVLNFS